MLVAELGLLCFMVGVRFPHSRQVLGRAGDADCEGFGRGLGRKLVLDLGGFDGRVGNVESGAGGLEEVAEVGAGVEVVVFRVEWSGELLLLLLSFTMGWEVVRPAAFSESLVSESAIVSICYLPRFPCQME